MFPMPEVPPEMFGYAEYLMAKAQEISGIETFRGMYMGEWEPEKIVAEGEVIAPEKDRRHEDRDLIDSLRYIHGGRAGGKMEHTRRIRTI